MRAENTYENTYENALDALHLVYGYASMCNDKNLRSFVNAVICGNDATEAAKFYISDLPCVLDKMGVSKPDEPVQKPLYRSICVTRPRITKRRS